MRWKPGVDQWRRLEAGIYQRSVPPNRLFSKSWWWQSHLLEYPLPCEAVRNHYPSVSFWWSSFYGVCREVSGLLFLAVKKARNKSANIDSNWSLQQQISGRHVTNRKTKTIALFRRHIAEKWFRLLVSVLLFRGLSVCHVRALCSNGKRYRHNFLQHTIALRLSQVAFKFGL